MRLARLLLILSLSTQIQLTIQAPTSRTTRLSKSKPFLAPRPDITKNKQVQVERAGSSDSSLWDLIDQKPKRLDDDAGEEYIDDFGRHPSIQSINLHDPKHTETIHQLINLSAGARDTKQRHTFHALIDRHLEKAQADPTLIATYKGQRYRQKKKPYAKQRYLAKKTQDPIGFRRKAREAREKSNAKVSQRGPVLELSEFLGETLSDPKMSAIQLAEKARAYREEYGSECTYTAALKRYLKGNKFSKDDIDAATGWTAWQVNNERRRMLDGTAKGILGAGLSSRNMKWGAKALAVGQPIQKKQEVPDRLWAKVPRRARTAVIHYPPVSTSPAASSELGAASTRHAQMENYPAARVMPEDWWKTDNL
jgi:hypothetical protein